LVMYSQGTSAAGVVYFMTIEKARFRKPVEPGDLLRMPVKLVRRRGPVWKFEGKAFSGDTLVAEAEFSAMISAAADTAG
jgi:3-hydroxyacyl-[acyl-carrier-protein] dehydratase